MTVLVGLNGLADWSAAQPFINVLKCGRPWQGRSPTQYTSHSEAVMRSGGHLDAEGNPIRIPPGADRVGTIILTEINASDTTLNGRYRLTWTGEGTLHLHGVSNIQRGNGFAEFDYRATGTNLVAIELTQIDAANPLKLVACVRTDHIARHAAGEMFRPAWLDQVRGFPLFRFMDWQATNNSTQRVWADRMRASSYSYVPGAPVEVMVALCNLVGADPWFCYPHLATDDYITRFAQYVRANLRADLTAHYEFSNEVWNWQFEQAQWANRQGQALWPGQGDAWVQYYAGRSTEMADLLDAVYAGTTGRHRKVLTTQTGWIGLEPGILNAPQWVAEQAGRKAPKDAHDCYAITGYFDTGKHGQEGSVEIQQWRQLGETAAFQRMADACDASITRLIETWRYHKRAADAAGLDLVMYEGGSHIVPDHGVLNQNPGLLEFIEKFHYSAHMGRLYSRAIAGFEAAGGEAFNVFVEMARSGIHGFWGGLRHAADSNPRWDAVKAALDGTDVTPAPVDPLPEPEDPPVVVDPPVDPEPEQPPAEPEPEEPNMADRDKLNELLSILKTTTASLETYLADNPIVVSPPVEEPEPEPTPEPQPTKMKPGFRYVQDFGIDRELSYNWGDPNINIYLPNWAGGDGGNGVGGSVGTPSLIDYNDDKTVTINARMIDGKWCNGAMQVNRPQAPMGKWGAVVTSHTAKAVNAFFVYASNGKELDFELVKRNGVIGWAPAVHMPRQGGGRASSSKRQMALLPFELGVEQRLTVELLADRCLFWVDGVLLETIRPSDMADGYIWDTTTNAYAMATIERHRSWAGWNVDDYAQPSSMTVHGFLLPNMPA